MIERPADLRRELQRLKPSEAPSDRSAAHRARVEYRLCAALLAGAIERAERWYAAREDQLRMLDRRATATVGRLVADGRIRPSPSWHLAYGLAPAAAKMHG